MEYGVIGILLGYNFVLRKYGFRGRWSATPKNRELSEKTQGWTGLKSGSGSLAVGTYLQRGSAPFPRGPGALPPTRPALEAEEWIYIYTFPLNIIMLKDISNLNICIYLYNKRPCHWHIFWLYSMAEKNKQINNLFSFRLGIVQVHSNIELHEYSPYH